MSTWPRPGPDVYPLKREDRTRLCFFDLPSKIREKIYGIILIKTWERHPIEAQVHSLVPPAFLQASNRMRYEAMPIYYGLNDFSITLPVEFDDQVNFEHMCAALVAGGCLRLLSHLEVSYAEPAVEDEANYLIGFDLAAQAPEHLSETEAKGLITGENLDWNSFLAVSDAFCAALKAQCGGEHVVLDMDESRGLPPIIFMQSTMYQLLIDAPQLREHVLVWCDYGH